jgi:hypothetical protein
MIGVRQVFDEKLAGLSSLRRYLDEPEAVSTASTWQKKGLMLLNW